MPRLAWNNTRRNWIRSILVIGGMAVAAFIMAASQSLTEGHVSWAFARYRAFMGGDLVAYPLEMVVEGRAQEDQVTWVWDYWDHPWVNDLASFYPSLSQQGFVRPQESPVAYFEVDRLPPVILDHPQVRHVEPYLVMPGLVPDATRGMHHAPLRSLEIEPGRQRGWEDLIVQGRFFSEDEEDRMVALVNGASSAYHLTDQERSYPVPPAFEFIEVEIPYLLGFRDGFPVYDFSDLKRVRLRVVGHFAVELYEEWIMNADGNPVRGGIDQIVYFPHYWHTPQIVIPSGTWHQLFQERSGGQTPRAYQLGITVEDPLTARTTAREIEGELARATVMTVGDQVQTGNLFTRRVSRSVPAHRAMELMQKRTTMGQPVASQDVSQLMAGLSFLLAGCLVIANAHILVMNRRKELGILRALGMSGGEVMVLVLLELALLSLIGALLGFFLVSGLVGLALLASGAGLWHALLESLGSGLLVVGAALSVSLFFGFWPALKAVRSTTMEVLSDE